VFVEASFYYGLQVANLFNLFRLYKTSFHQVVVGIAAETIRDVATAYNTLDYFTNRSAIDTAMTTALTRQLATGAYADVSLFNLLAIDVPDAFDQAVQDKVLTAADVITLEQTRLSQVIRSTISVTDAYADANVTVIVANATAQGTVIRNQAEADAKVQYMTARGASLGQLSADLNFTTSKDLLTYLYAGALPHELLSDTDRCGQLAMRENLGLS
jgi:regulator of protease activity HflC (stomatin/prohibitin superfamily)